MTIGEIFGTIIFVIIALSIIIGFVYSNYFLYKNLYKSDHIGLPIVVCLIGWTIIIVCIFNAINWDYKPF